MTLTSTIKEYVVTYQRPEFLHRRNPFRWRSRVFYDVEDARWFCRYMKVVKGRNSYITEKTPKDIKV